MIAIINCGISNIHSVLFAIQRIGKDAVITHDKDLIANASHVIFPGVGTAGAAMEALKTYELDALIPTLTQPVLGICLGMQLLFEYSEESQCAGLGVFSGSVEPFAESELAVPHMGWNTITIKNKGKLYQQIPDQSYMYFVHGFMVHKANEMTAGCHYINDFCASVSRENFHATQFHPERSGEPGQQLLKNFLEL